MANPPRILTARTNNAVVRGWFFQQSNGTIGGWEIRANQDIKILNIFVKLNHRGFKPMKLPED